MMWVLKRIVETSTHSIGLCWIIRKISCGKELFTPSYLHVLKSLLDNITLWCGYSKESSHWDDSFEYTHHRVWLDNKRDIVEKRAVYSFLSGHTPQYFNKLSAAKEVQMRLHKGELELVSISHSKILIWPSNSMLCVLKRDSGRQFFWVPQHRVLFES